MESSGLIRVGDFSIDKRVRDLIVGDDHEKFPLAIGRGGKKVDIYRFGVLILSFALGDIVQDPVVLPNGINETFKDFLKKCLLKDERDRWSADQLLEHPWMKLRIEHMTSPLRDTGATNEPLGDDTKRTPDHIKEEEDDDEEEKPLPFYWVGSGGQSRLQSEFSFLSKLGKGGFGEVYKVKNNLDSQIYAIKRIQLDPKNKQLTKKLKKEVELLSRLNHENVVRYYYSWIELTEYDNSADLEDSFDDDYFSSGKHDKSLSVSVLNNDFDDDEEDDDDDNLFGSYNFNDCSDDDIIFEHSESSMSESNNEVSESVPTDDDTDGCHNCEPELKKNVKMVHFMYVQMEYCDNETLRSAIDNNLYKDSKRVWRMFREIIEGLLHIHSQGTYFQFLMEVVQRKIV